MSGIKLVYFDLRSRGEPIRLVLEAAGKKYEEVRVSFDEWPSVKPDTPFCQLPYIEYNGKRYGQSVALATFFARELGLYGKTNLDGLRIDEVVGLAVDFINSIYTARFESDEERKAELYEKLYSEEVPKYLGFFQRLLRENASTGFFVGSTISLADLFVYNVLDSIIAEKADVAKSFPPELTKLRSTVESHPFLHNYLLKRPKVDF